MQFEWDVNKNSLNLKKHKISFEEAKTIFYNELTMVANDPDHSNQEDRFIAIGYSSLGKLLLVVHCYRDKDRIIRIISARKANNSERKQFEEGL